MPYQISEQLISYNRSHQVLSPVGFAIHSTATPNASAKNEHDYFNSGNRSASVHYFADWTQIIRCVPENEVAWHAGNTANHKYLSVEMCEPTNDSVKFQEVWNRTVWLVADACVRYGWNTEDNVWSHRGISNLYHETDHQDPIAFLASYGKTWDQLLQAIDEKINDIRNPIQNDNEGDDFEMDVAVVYFTPADFSIALIIANLNNGCATFCRNGSASVNPVAMKAKKVYTIGGGKLGHSNEIYLSGDTAKETLIAVANNLQGK